MKMCPSLSFCRLKTHTALLIKSRISSVCNAQTLAIALTTTLFQRDPFLQEFHSGSISLTHERSQQPVEM